MPRHWLAHPIPVVIALSFIITFQQTPVLARSSGSSSSTVSGGAQVPSPRSVLGFSPGDDRTMADWGEIVNYFQLLDRASDRIATEIIGETTMGRPFIVAFISAPENIRDLTKYKEIQR